LQQMLEPLYLQFRAQRIDPQHAMPEAPAGAFAQHAAALAPDTHEFADATSQMAIVDAQGNALSVTTTINLNFGSWLMVDGYVLNNAMTNFSNAPPPGQARANQMAPGKRPITSMSPTIVFDERQVPVVVGGSAGGGQIVDYISASLIELLANGRTPEQALARGHVSTAISGTVQLEKGTPAAEQADALRAKGHTVTVTEMKSGLAFVKREGNAWTGAADPRRDGSAQPLQPSP
jgi:gamma-glutamyltranspeptidase/glutathione hydrolase